MNTSLMINAWLSAMYNEVFIQSSTLVYSTMSTMMLLIVQKEMSTGYSAGVSLGG